MEEYSAEPRISFPKTYRITLGRRLFVILTSIPILIFIAGILAVLAVRGPGNNIFNFILIMIIVAGNCVIFIPRLLAALCTSVTIESGKIIYRILWIRRELAISEAQGFEVNRTTNAIQVVPDQPWKKKITLSVHLEEFLEISKWAKATFRNLSAEQYKSELSDIFTSGRYGPDHRTRIQKFQIALLRARSINTAAVIVSVWTLLYPEPYLLAIVASALLPIIAIWALVSSRGLILLDAHTWRVPPTIAQAFLMPALALFFRAYSDYSLISMSNLWLPLAIGIVVIGVVLFAGVGDFRKERHAIVPAIIFIVIFVYGFIIEANCLFDPNPSRIASAGVVKKRINYAIFPAFYRVGLNTWEFGGPPAEEHVTKEVYEALEVGDTACIEVHQGLFNIPWYNVTWCKK